MASTINATPTSSGLISTADSTGVLALQTGGTTAVTIDGSQNVSMVNNLSFNSGYGSAATAYGCRAWVNFNGTGTVAIRASGNVSSLTDVGTGEYRVNLTTAMPDANYSVVVAGVATGSLDYQTPLESAPLVGSFSIYSTNGGAAVDSNTICASVFR